MAQHKNAPPPKIGSQPAHVSFGLEDEIEGDARSAEDEASDADWAQVQADLSQLDLSQGSDDEDADGQPAPADADDTTNRSQRIVPLRALYLLNPFARQAERRGLHFLPLLRRQLLRDPIETIDGLELRLERCIAMQAASSDKARLMKVAYALQARFGPMAVQPRLVQALIFLRDFAEARTMATAHVQANRQDFSAQDLAAQAAMIAGVPGPAHDRYRRVLQLAVQDGLTSHYNRLVHILIEAGEIDWLKQHFPQQTAECWAAGVAERLAPQTEQVPIYCISLDQDAARYRATSSIMAPAGPIERIPGVKGAYLPETARNRMMADPEVRLSPGEVGCHLSHMTAWERIAARCAADEYALVTEDDARFLYGPGMGLTEVLAAARKASADLLFVNIRACIGATREHPWKGDDVAILPIDHPFRHQWAIRNPGWGTDGYLISGRGAQRMLEGWRAVGLAGSIDWQMYLMAYRQFPDWLRNRHTQTAFDALRRRGIWPVMPGFTTNLPIIHTRDFGFSAINAG